MIFVTVGHQMPFDRLIRLVERWAVDNPDAEVVAQIADSELRPTAFKTSRWLAPSEFEAHLDQCTAVVSHAGTGNIIQALMRSKPTLVLPRLASHGETRNDHQVGTARYFEGRRMLMAAYDDDSFVEALGRLRTFVPDRKIGSDASPELVQRIRGFIADVAT